MEECGAGKSLDGDDIACTATLILTFSGPVWKIWVVLLVTEVTLANAQVMQRLSLIVRSCSHVLPFSITGDLFSRQICVD